MGCRERCRERVLGKDGQESCVKVSLLFLWEVLQRATVILESNIQKTLWFYLMWDSGTKGKINCGCSLHRHWRENAFKQVITISVLPGGRADLRRFDLCGSSSLNAKTFLPRYIFLHLYFINKADRPKIQWSSPTWLITVYSKLHNPKLNTFQPVTNVLLQRKMTIGRPMRHLKRTE